MSKVENALTRLETIKKDLDKISKSFEEQFGEFNSTLSSGYEEIKSTGEKGFQEGEKKIEEDGGNTDLSKYEVNLGRSNDEIKNMKSRVKNELFEVLTVDERKNFNLDKALERMNKMMEKVK